MFEKLFQQPTTIARHYEAPYVEERIRYLEHCAQLGYSRATLLFKAREIFWIAHKLSIYPNLHLSMQQVESSAKDWADREHYYGQSLNTYWTRRRFLEAARPWLRYLKCLLEPGCPTSFPDQVHDYTEWMEKERGFTSATRENYLKSVRHFLTWYESLNRPFSRIKLGDIDAYLIDRSEKGWSRITISNVAGGLRSFFGFAATKGWCSSHLADGIPGPRIYSQENLPSGPTWQEIKRLLAETNNSESSDIRDRAILLLFAIYGFRASEVAQLSLDDFDWDHELIHVFRNKRQESQLYPLVAEVGNAIILYLQRVRPSCSHRSIFLTLLPPYRPLTRKALYSLTSKRLRKLGIALSHYGPHSLRHACASHLVAEGLSLKEIGDHLGHRSASATRIYAKVDINGLREVASFDLGGVL